VILTAGDVTRDRLRAEPELVGTRIETLGSVRAVGPATSTIEHRPSVCLVLPEGIVDECVTLVRAAVQAAEALPSTIFRIRLHPIVGREQVENAAPDLRTIPLNVEWSSTDSLEKDLIGARWALYRGSSTVIQAVQAGVKPFYYALGEEVFNLDPLAPLAEWRERVLTTGELINGILKDAVLPVDRREPALMVAQEFCNRYFMPMRPDALAELMVRVFPGLNSDESGPPSSR
jgi:hypothetical protein